MAHYSMTLKGHLSGAINLQINASAAFQGADMLSEWGNQVWEKHQSVLTVVKLLLLPEKIENSF